MKTKTIEIWAPEFAEQAANIDVSTLGKTKATQVNLQEFLGAEKFDFEGNETPGLTSLGIKDFLRTQVQIRPHNVSMTDLSANLKDALTNFQQLVNDLPKPASGYFIEEIEINLGVNGKGGITLIGKMEVGMDAAIKVKIKREAK